MYDMEILISIVYNFLDMAAKYKKYEIAMRRYAASASPTNIVYLGMLFGQYQHGYWALSDVCKLLDIDQKRLVSAVKSMLRWERSRSRWDCKSWIMGINMKESDKERLAKYLSKSS